MENSQWPYKEHTKQMYEERILTAEKILQIYGATYMGDVRENETFIGLNEFEINETVNMHTWKFQNQYIHVDRLYFQKKPFIVLEFSKDIQGPYEDADPFPYDLPIGEFEDEIRESLGISEIKGVIIRKG